MDWFIFTCTFLGALLYGVWRSRRTRQQKEFATSPTAAEREAIDAFPTPVGGDAEDRATAMIWFLRQRDIVATHFVIRDGSATFVGIRLPSGAFVAPKNMVGTSETKLK